MENVVLSVSELVSLVNQTFEFAFGVVYVEGEVSEFRVSKNKWVYFNLIDKESKIHCFASVYSLSTVIEDGMTLKVKGSPKLHNKYGFSLNISYFEPIGEGSLKKAFELLKAKLEKEGLFAPARKRELPKYPDHVGIVGSKQSAGYADFIKIANQRWRGVEFKLIDVQVQGEPAVDNIVTAIETFNQLLNLPQAIVLLRGGGSSDDLQAFNTEKVVRSISLSRIPIITGVGHEIDITLADLTADVRASTPSNAAEILVPDAKDVMSQIAGYYTNIELKIGARVKESTHRVNHLQDSLSHYVNIPVEKTRLLNLHLHMGSKKMIKSIAEKVVTVNHLLNTYNPNSVLKRGYSIVRLENSLIKNGSGVGVGDKLVIELVDAIIKAGVINVTKK